MGLPKQIQRQIKDGKKIEDQINAELLERDGPDQTQAEIDALMAEVNPDDKPTAEVTTLHPDKPEGGDPELTPEPEPKLERKDWKQMYNVLQGKYDAEVPRLASDLQAALGRIKDLEEKPTSTPTETPVPEPTSAISAEEIKDYGEDLLDVIGRKAREIAKSEFAPVIDGLNQQITTLQSQIGATGQRVAGFEQDKVFTVLDREVKDWRKTNVDPTFNSWLDQVDPFSGLPRKRLMLDAFDAKNAQRVKAFFESFMKENAAVTPDPTATPAAPAGSDATLALSDYIAPGTPKSSGQAGAPKESRNWTNKEVGKFYSDVQKGHYKNRPEDKARVEAEIIAATREGRVQP